MDTLLVIFFVFLPFSVLLLSFLHLCYFWTNADTTPLCGPPGCRICAVMNLTDEAETPCGRRFPLEVPGSRGMFAVIQEAHPSRQITVFWLLSAAEAILWTRANKQLFQTNQQTRHTVTHTHCLLILQWKKKLSFTRKHKIWHALTQTGTTTVTLCWTMQSDD